MVETDQSLWSYRIEGYGNVYCGWGNAGGESTCFACRRSWVQSSAFLDKESQLASDVKDLSIESLDVVHKTLRRALLDQSKESPCNPASSFTPWPTTCSEGATKEQPNLFQQPIFFRFQDYPTTFLHFKLAQMYSRFPYSKSNSLAVIPDCLSTLVWDYNPTPWSRLTRDMQEKCSCVTTDVHKNADRNNVIMSFPGSKFLTLIWRRKNPTTVEEIAWGGFFSARQLQILNWAEEFASCYSRLA